MASARDQMELLKATLVEIRNEIEKLRAQEELLEKLISEMIGVSPPRSTRTRSPSVKPLVLDILTEAGTQGATTSEVDRLVRDKVPTVAKDTVGSVLSRLKSDGALIYNGERYYLREHAPSAPSPSDRTLKAVQ